MMEVFHISPKTYGRINNSGLLKRVIRYKMVYVLLLPSVICFLVFAYTPMAGIFMAFNHYSLGKGFKGIFTSPWVGFDNFKSLFGSDYFLKVLRNTLLISIYKIIFGFPIPIIFALLLNELKNKFFKRLVQTITYLPYFLSSVVVVGIVIALLSPVYGLINAIIVSMGGQPIHFLANPQYFRSIIVAIDIWCFTGWNAIIYLAAISSVDPGLYDAAVVDGAGKFRQVWHVTLPGISDIIILLLILSVGNILNAGFETIFLLYSPIVYSVSDIIDTYTYRVGLIDTNYSFSAAVGLFKSVICFVLILLTNRIANRFDKAGVW